MTQEEIVQGNRLIAEFMGGKFNKDTTMLLEVPIKSPVSGKDIRCIDKLKFHSSWDWQIYAWSKLTRLMQNFVTKQEGDDHEFFKNRYYWFLKRYGSEVDGNDPLGGFRVLVDALTWYNQQEEGK